MKQPFLWITQDASREIEGHLPSPFLMLIASTSLIENEGGFLIPSARGNNIIVRRSTIGSNANEDDKEKDEEEASQVGRGPLVSRQLPWATQCVGPWCPLRIWRGGGPNPFQMQRKTACHRRLRSPQFKYFVQTAAPRGCAIAKTILLIRQNRIQR